MMVRLFSRDAVAKSPCTCGSLPGIYIIYAGFSKETARSFVESFEKYLLDNKDSIEALRIIYNSEDTVITYSMLCELCPSTVLSPDLSWHGSFPQN